MTTPATEKPAQNRPLVDTPASLLRNAIAISQLLDLEPSRGTLARSLVDIVKLNARALELLERPVRERQIHDTWFPCPTWCQDGPDTMASGVRRRGCNCEPVFACQEAGRVAAAKALEQEYGEMLATNRELRQADGDYDAEG